MSSPAVSLPLREAARARPRVLTAAAGATLLALTFAARLVLVRLRATPSYFPDEYMYTALSRSLAALGRPEIRGEAANFPALLAPLLTAPAWRIGNVETAYRVAQAIGAAATTLAALPCYLLARRLGVGVWVAVAVAASALLVPDTLYAGFLVAEPFAYPLVLGAVAAGVVALAEPRRRNIVLFLVLAGLATFARAQFVILPVAYLGAAAVISARERHLAALRAHLPVIALGVLGLAAALARGPSKVAGYYVSVLHPHVQALGLVQSLGRNGMLLAYAAGWILVPGALLGIAEAIRRPRNRLELSAGSLLAVFVTLLLVEASLFGETYLAQERYVFYAVPLLVLGFALYASRGWPHRIPLGALSAGMIAASARVPLSGYAAPGANDHSPFLFFVRQLEISTNSIAGGAGIVAVAALALSALGMGLGLRASRWRTGAVLVLALCASSTALAGATVFDHRSSVSARTLHVSADPQWVDHQNLGDVTLLTTGGGQDDALAQLFWNRSVRHVAVLAPGSRPDRFAYGKADIAADGTLVLPAALRGTALLVDNFATTVRFANATQVAYTQYDSLWRVYGKPRVTLFMPGRYRTGWLGGIGMIALWPGANEHHLAGRLTLTLTGAELGTTVRFGSGSSRRIVHVPANSHVVVRLPVCGPWWHISFGARIGGFVDGRAVSVQSSVPRYEAAPSACAAQRTGQRS